MASKRMYSFNNDADVLELQRLLLEDDDDDAVEDVLEEDYDTDCS